MVPSSLEMPKHRSFALEVALSTQHVLTVADALRDKCGGRQPVPLCTLCWVTDEANMITLQGKWDILPDVSSLCSFFF